MTANHRLLSTLKRSLFAGGFLIFILFLIPFEVQKSILDLIPPDGNLESFTFSVYWILQSIAFSVAILAVSLGFLISIHKERSVRILQSLQARFAHFRKSWLIDLRNLITWSISDLVNDKLQWALIGFIVLGVILRFAFIDRPMGHDETYTYMAFAFRGIKTTITDYHLPNNHVLHTILVVISTGLFGNSPEAIRLPAFVAGILIIPAVYLVAVKLFDRWVAFQSSAIVTGLPVLVDYSITARGHRRVDLFTLLLTALPPALPVKKKIMAWCSIVLVASLGMYTNPIMVYPTGMLFTWLLISITQKSVNEVYQGKMFLYVAFASCAILLLTGFFYLPILVNSGVSSIVGNEVVEALGWRDFWQSLPVRIRNTWAEWNRDLPEWISYPELLLLSFSFFFPKEKRIQRLSFWVAGFLFITAMLIVQRVAPWPRVWLFLLPLFAIWVAGGVINLSHFAGSVLKQEKLMQNVTTGLIVLMVLAGSSLRSYIQFSLKSGKVGETEGVAIFLEDYLRPGDVIVVTSPDAIVLKYYLLIHGISGEFSELRDDKPFDRAIVVVNTSYGQTMESVLERRSFLDDVNPQNKEIIYQSSRFILSHLQNQ